MDECKRAKTAAEAQIQELEEQISALKIELKSQHDMDMADIKGQAQSAALQAATQLAALQQSFEEDREAYQKKLDSYAQLVKRQEAEAHRLRAKHAAEVRLGSCTRGSS